MRAIRPAMSAADGVPIVGQPAKILGWSATFFVECSCGAHLTITGKAGAGMGCPQCRRAVIVKGFKTNGPGLEVEFQFAMMAPEGDDAAPTG